MSESLQRRDADHRKRQRRDERQTDEEGLGELAAGIREDDGNDRRSCGKHERHADDSLVGAPKKTPQLRPPLLRVVRGDVPHENERHTEDRGYREKARRGEREGVGAVAGRAQLLREDQRDDEAEYESRNVEHERPGDAAAEPGPQSARRFGEVRHVAGGRGTRSPYERDAATCSSDATSGRRGRPSALS